MIRRPPRSTLFPYTTSSDLAAADIEATGPVDEAWVPPDDPLRQPISADRKSTRLNSSHLVISYAVFCLKKKKSNGQITTQATLRHDNQHDINYAASRSITGS